MPTQLKLSNLKAYMLLVPGILGFLITEFSLLGTGNYRQGFSAANMLWVLNLLVLLSTQAYFTAAFDKATARKDTFTTLNAMVPVAFFAFYFLFVIYSALQAPETPAGSSEAIGPLREVKFSMAGTFIMVMLVYSGVSFLFVNNYLVKRRIQKFEDLTRRKELYIAFLLPMKRLVRAAVVVVGGVTLFAIIYDILKLTL
ncbi:hypothetical protein [Pontibacter russatus]|uniref:hypothetical protein n=1 Tax=Pontibacter russatus TaxID=2694929 RepID=UPI001379A0DD|nr:hypothetical protein [Pontibacter russatus]